MNQKILVTLLLILFSVNICHAVDDEATRVAWGYKGNIGPSRWAELDKHFILCATGKSQSPINITKSVVNRGGNLRVFYSPAALDIMNDGVTSLNINNVQTLVNEGHSIQVNFSADTNETVNLGDETFRLVQLHIHTPSENTWHGQAFPLEIHLVHQGANGKVLVIGVFGKGGEENTELQTIVDHIPTDRGKSHLIEAKSINPLGLLPEKKNYFSFMGSLTTPPCSEGLQWIVMADPITVSPAQVARLKKATNGSNARPVKPLNGRKVSYSTSEPAVNK